MNTRQFIDSDHATLAQWWAGYGWDIIPLASLPRFGLIIPDVCAGFVYFLDSNIALMEWIVGNPAADPTLRAQGLELLLTNIEAEAKQRGYQVIFHWTKRNKLITRLHERGYTTSDTGVTHLLKVIT